MNKNPLVSIIIPTYNRAHLIGETLDSVLAQTYQNWECMVGDDGSTDDTDELMKTYCEKDSRFIYAHRKKNMPKGANACRNLGLEKTKGEYIIFFDSDDLMTKEHIAAKLNAIQMHNADYVVSKTKNLDGSSYPKHYYAFKNKGLTANDYITHQTNWLTLDVIIKKEVLQEIRFNESLQSGQEYNFYCKLVLKSVNCYFLDEYLSLRRMTPGSTRKSLDSDFKLRASEFFKEMETFQDLDHRLDREVKIYFLLKCIRKIYQYPKLLDGYHKFLRGQIFKVIGVKYLLFDGLLIAMKLGYGHYLLRNRLLKAIEKAKN